VNVVFFKRSRPQPCEVDTASPAALGVARYDASSDVAVILLGADDLSEACPLESDDVCVLWANGRLVGVAVSNASVHMPVEVIDACDALNVLHLGRLEQDLT
jgi:hypothetical protein